MHGLEQLLGLFVAAVILAAAARRVGAPYPVFLAVGGALLAFLPVGSAFTLPPNWRWRCSLRPFCSMLRTTRRCGISKTTGHRSAAW